MVLAVSVAAVAWAFEQPLPPNEKVVLLALADCENGQTALCIPGQERIAEMASMSVRSVQRMLAKLEEGGYIRREHRTSQATGYRTSDSYILALRDNLSGRSEPTRQIVQHQATTVSSIGEPEVGTGSTPPTPSADDAAFEALWMAWPKKVAEDTARREWKRLNAAEKQEAIPLIVAHANAHRDVTPPHFWPRLSVLIRDKVYRGPLPVARGGQGQAPRRPDVKANDEWMYR